MVHAMGIPDIISSVANELGVNDLASFSGVCKCYSYIARRELRGRVCNVMKVYISPWTEGYGWNLSYTIVVHIKAFFQMLRENRSAVAGLTALAVLRSHTTDIKWATTHDMELFTPRRRASAVVHYLTTMERYSVETPAEPHEPGPRNPQRLRKHLSYWRRRTAVNSVTGLFRESDRRRIFVIESITQTAILPIAQTVSTLSCNWLDWDGIVCAYPRETFNDTGFYHPNISIEPDSQIFLRVEGCDIRTYKHTRYQCDNANSYCPRRERRSEDSMTFRMSLWPHRNHTPWSNFDHYRTRYHRQCCAWTWGDWDVDDVHMPAITNSSYVVVDH